MKELTMKERQAALKSKWAESRKLHAEMAALKESLQGECDHSETFEYQWEHDNGYGHQSKHYGMQCEFCGWRDPFKLGRFKKPYYGD